MGSPEQVWQRSFSAPTTAAVGSEAHWYAVHTRARHEKKVAAQLEDKSIETFLPLNTRVHRWSDRSKKVQLPIFPCYTFLRLDGCIRGRLTVLNTPGVLGFVGVRGVGSPIPDKEIEDIQTLLAHNVPCTPYPFLKPGQRVRIRGGCLEGVEGILVSTNGNRNLVISMELIGRSVAVRIEGYDVEPL
jgi:transcription antitermination factor NusG